MAFKDLSEEDQHRIRAERKAFKTRLPRVRKNKKINALLERMGHQHVLPLKHAGKLTGKLLLRTGKPDYPSTPESRLPIYLRKNRLLKPRLKDFLRTFCFWDLALGEIGIRPEVPREELPESFYWNFSNVLGRKITLPPCDESFSKAQILCFLHSGKLADQVGFLNGDKRDTRISNLNPKFFHWTDKRCAYFNRVDQGKELATAWLAAIEASRKIPFWLKAYVDWYVYSKPQNRNKIRLCYQLGDKTVMKSMHREYRLPITRRCDLSTGNPIDIIKAYHEMCINRQAAVEWLSRTGLYELRGVRANYLTQQDAVLWRQEPLSQELLHAWCSLYPEQGTREWLLSHL